MASPEPQSLAQDAPAAASEIVSGLVERVVFHNPDSGFCVLRVKLQDRREPATVVGESTSVAPGELVRARGIWQTDPSFGLQFRARALDVLPPSTVDGIEAYLGSGMIKGIGRALAGKLVRAFGERVFEVIERRPERLREVPGIGRGLAQRIAAAWEGQRAIRDIMLFLHSHGLSPLRAARIFETYGQDAIRQVTSNPYRLAQDIRGIGFASADQLAMRLGIAPDSPLRLGAGLAQVLSEAQAQGHAALPRDELIRGAGRLLGVEAGPLEAALDKEIDAGALIADDIDGTACIFLAALHRAEQEIAATLRRLASGRPGWKLRDRERAVGRVERDLCLTLATSQRRALDLALESRALVITGGPGTGKTTLVRAILKALSQSGIQILLAAPTGRAAKRLSESTGQDAKTLHRLLEADPGRGFRRGAKRPLECGLLVVDEVSMVDVLLMQALLAALPEDAGLFLIGDVDQLPSIGPGQVLADVIASDAVPVVRLEEIFRQAAESRIVRNAHRINQALMPELDRAEGEVTDFYAIRARDPEEGARIVLDLASERIPARFGVDAVTDIQVLCPTNRGPLGARHLNELLQQTLNPDPPQRIERQGITFALGDKIMQLENDYEREVYNGDLGRVVGIDQSKGRLSVEIDGRVLSYGFGELNRLVPAYAITVHKAQGSEYPVVVLPLAAHHGRMLRRNLVYTAITRARRLVVVVAEPGALELAVAERPEPRRWSKLCSLLAAAPPQRQLETTS
jgi:exodeoxyribonuclease V alpha subunit